MKEGRGGNLPPRHTQDPAPVASRSTRWIRSIQDRNAPTGFWRILLLLLLPLPSSSYPQDETELTCRGTMSLDRIAGSRFSALRRASHGVDITTINPFSIYEAAWLHLASLYSPELYAARPVSPRITF